MSEILHKEPEPVRRVAGGVPQELERIIRRCLKKDPTRRFQNMADLKVALQELKEESESGKLSAETAKPGKRVRKWVLPAAVPALQPQFS